jgi:hypothetical protein
LTLGGSPAALRAGQCVNGLGRSLFGQVAFCGAQAFFDAANKAVRAGKLRIPPLGRAKDGRPCPSVRDFSLVDQDQSDNVTTTYLATPDGRTAQATAANARALGRPATLANGSDNRLLDVFVDPALGCTPFTAPDLTDGGRPATSLALNELQAAAGQRAPVALVPQGDPMTLVDGKPSQAKANLYRAGVDQPALDRRSASTRSYCRNLRTSGLDRLTADRRLLRAAPSPDDGVGLLKFLTRPIRRRRPTPCGRWTRSRTAERSPQCPGDLLAQLRQLGVEAVAGALGVVEVAVALDLGNGNAVLAADEGAEGHEGRPLRLGRLDAGVGAFVLDADGVGVLPGAVRALDHGGAAEQGVEAAVPPFEPVPAAADGEVLPGVGPAVVVDVVVLIVPGDLEGVGQGVVGAVGAGDVVDQDAVGRVVEGGEGIGGRPRTPLGA